VLPIRTSTRDSIFRVHCIEPVAFGAVADGRLQLLLFHHLAPIGQIHTKTATHGLPHTNEGKDNLHSSCHTLFKCQWFYFAE
jgi:hypothetical protein